MMLNIIFTILIGLSIGLLAAGICIGIYAILFVRKPKDHWGWGEIVEQLRKDDPGKGW